MADVEAKVGIEFDQSRLGQILGETEITVTEEVILRYSKATGETDPKYTTPGPDLIAPPAICAIIQVPRGDLEINFPFAKVTVYGSAALYPYIPIRAGDKLRATAKLADVYTKTGRSGPMGFVVYENEFMREDGTLVARTQNTFISRA